MNSMKERGDGSVRYIVQFLIFLVVLVSATSFLSVALPSKILLIGAAFIALAVWGKRKLKDERNS